MAADSVIVHCRVYDGIQSLDVPMEQCITPEMLQHCRFAQSRHVNHIEDNKYKGSKVKKTKRGRQYWKHWTKHKKETKVSSKETTHTVLRKEADQLAIDAEKKNEMDLIVKSNAPRSKAKEKMVQLQTEEH